MGSSPTFGIMTNNNAHDNDIVARLREKYFGELVCEAADEIERLRAQIKELKNGFEGCCPACEPVGEINKKLREERDEARREVMSGIIDQACRSEDIDREYKKRGWEYLKENK